MSILNGRSQIIMYTGAASTTATDAGDHWVLNGTKVIHMYTVIQLVEGGKASHNNFQSEPP